MLTPHKHFSTGLPCNCTWARHHLPEWEDHHASAEENPDVIQEILRTLENRD